MNWNTHSNLRGAHAFLGASKYHWLNYDDKKLRESYLNSLAVQRGVELHEFAASCIRLGQKLPKSSKTLNAYVNDAIGFKMTPEQILYFSENCFGTADAISFWDKTLRIHDLKTGVTPAHMQQLLIYAGLFCLEYKADPKDIGCELRIYQQKEVIVHNPEPKEISDVMKKIVNADKIIFRIRKEQDI